ncbi:DUF6798 domain-containing protein [Dokdonella sp.]|uniref:DUF6798 domain-containing protein n=1 Tax=Dokdonella sp. TaxID=2291710 RepID=UPI002F3E8DD6
MPHWPAALGASAMAIACTLLAIALDHGIRLGSENHAGLLPVMRRILDPGYLPGDFGISIRLHHHHTFTWAAAMLASVIGENGALASLTVIGLLAIFAGLWRVGDALDLAPARRVLLGVAIAIGLAWLDRGVEANRFLGNGPIMPPTFAHALILFGIDALLRRRWNLAFALAGAVALVHLQIGAVWLVTLAAVGVGMGIAREPRRWLPGACAAIVIALPALADVWALLHEGLVRGIARTEDVAFRMPQHFEFRADRVAAVALYLGAFVVLWRRWRARGDARADRFLPLLWIAGCLMALSALHYLDYYVLHSGWIARLQLLRLSMFVPVLAAFALLAAPTPRPRERWPLALATLFAFGALGAGWAKHAPPSLAVEDEAQASTDWADVTRWVRANGPAGRYVTPPGQIGFTAYSDRSTVVEFKVNPDGGAGLDEWLHRLDAVTAGALPPASTRRDVAAELDAAYAKLTDADFRRLVRDYGVRTAVVPAASPLQGKVVYRNAGYRVVALDP